MSPALIARAEFDLSFMDRLSKAREDPWKELRACNSPSVSTLGTGWPRALPINFLAPDEAWAYHALVRPEEAPFTIALSAAEPSEREMAPSAGHGTSQARFCSTIAAEALYICTTTLSIESPKRLRDPQTRLKTIPMCGITCKHSSHSTLDVLSVTPTNSHPSQAAKFQTASPMCCSLISFNIA